MLASPLRYPGGKTKLAPTVAAILDASGLGAGVLFVCVNPNRSTDAYLAPSPQTRSTAATAFATAVSA